VEEQLSFTETERRATARMTAAKKVLDKHKDEFEKELKKAMDTKQKDKK
jgi:hypothetical protein